MWKCRLNILVILAYILMMVIILKLHYKLKSKNKIYNLSSLSLNRRYLMSNNSEYFEDGSKCQSLFTVNSDISIIGYKWQEITRKLKHFRMRDTFATINNVLYDIATFLPIPYKVKQQKSYSEDKMDFDFFTNEASITEWPFIPCEVYMYKQKDVRKCTKLLRENSGQPLRIAFMGDSMTRSIMEELVFMLHNNASLKCLHSKQIDMGYEFYIMKIKENLAISGCGLDLRLYWAPYLERNRSNVDVMKQGARDVLEDWAYNKKNVKQDPVPDILYISSGIWLGSHQSGEQALDEYVYMIKDIYPMLKVISNHTRIIWHVHPLILEAKVYSVLDDGVAEGMNQIAHYMFQKSNIWLWESLSIIHTREKMTCINLMNAGILTPERWKCTDAVHPGEIARKAATNMLLNLACNRILAIKGNKCC